MFQHQRRRLEIAEHRQCGKRARLPVLWVLGLPILGLLGLPVWPLLVEISKIAIPTLALALFRMCCRDPLRPLPHRHTHRGNRMS
jgi:hypothetical protein